MIWFVGSVFLLFLLRVPVAFAFLLPSVVYLSIADHLSVAIAIQRSVAGVNSFPLLAVPLFILMGNLSNSSGLTDRLFGFAEAFIGHVRNSLGYVNILVSVIFAWMSGAAIADAAGLGKIEVPAMVRRGYSERFALGITASSSTIGPMMPPSIPAVVYAVVAGVSVGGLLIAGIVPALIIAGLLAATVWVHGLRNRIPGLPKASWAERRHESIRALWAMLTPVILIGGILGGKFTPTEAAGVAVAYLLVLAAFVYRTMGLKAIYRAFVSSAETTGSVLFIVASGSLFGWILAVERAPQSLSDLVLGITDNPLMFLLMVNLFLLLIGMFLEPSSAILIVVPILLPIATAIGIHPLQFGMIVIFNLMIGLVTPPVGLVLYVLSSVTNIPVSVVSRGVVLFYIPLIAALACITLVPSVSLWLPRLIGLA